MKPFQTMLVSGVAIAMLAAAPAHAAKISDVSAESQRWMVASAESQKRVDTLSDQRNDLSDKFRATLRESEGIKLYIQQLRAQIASQSGEMDVIKAETREIERTSIDILPLMQNMLASLDKFVELDMPFLHEERAARVKKLKDMMPRADVTVSEKYRRIVEAYQIEMEYGRTTEAYTAEVQGKAVDVLRVGRVALLYQSPDRKETAYRDSVKKAWVVDDHFAEGVREGLKVARKQSSPDLLVVPVLAAGKGG